MTWHFHNSFFFIFIQANFAYSAERSFDHKGQYNWWGGTESRRVFVENTKIHNQKRIINNVGIKRTYRSLKYLVEFKAVQFEYKAKHLNCFLITWSNTIHSHCWCGAVKQSSRRTKLAECKLKTSVSFIDSFVYLFINSSFIFCTHNL